VVVKIKDRLKIYLKSQTTNMGGVKPEQRYRDNRFYFTSPAGDLTVIVKQIKHNHNVSRFRDAFINRFEQITKESEYFELYKEIFETKGNRWRVKYKANLHTRLKGKLCSLIPWS